MIQRRPRSCLCPQWCSLCKSSSESVGHLFLHCPVTFNLWLRLFREFDISWVLSKDCSSFLSERHKLPGKGPKAKVLWGCSVLAVLWVVWLERNISNFDNHARREGEELWEKVRVWSSLWASTSSEFRDLSFRFIWHDWKAALLLLSRLSLLSGLLCWCLRDLCCFFFFCAVCNSLGFSSLV